MVRKDKQFLGVVFSRIAAPDLTRFRPRGVSPLLPCGAFDVVREFVRVDKPRGAADFFGLSGMICTEKSPLGCAVKAKLRSDINFLGAPLTAGLFL